MKISLKLFSVFFLIIVSSGFLSAQQNVFAKVYYEISGGVHAQSVVRGYDQNYIVVGAIDQNALVMKIDTNGIVIWAKKYSISSQWYIESCDLVVASDGFLCYLTGGLGVTMLKTDFSGAVLWSKTNTTNNGGSFGYAGDPPPKLHPTIDGGYIAIGFHNPWSSFTEVYKYDSAANLVWVRGWQQAAMDVACASDGGYFVVGNGPTHTSKLGDIFSAQIGVIKTDSLGNSNDCIVLTSVIQGNDTASSAVVSCSAVGIAEISGVPQGVADVLISEIDGCVYNWNVIKEYSLSECAIKIFPNPGNGIFQISIDPNDNLHFKDLEIYNVLGEMIFRSELLDILSKPIDISSEPDGIYFLKANFTERNFSKKIIICR